MNTKKCERCGEPLTEIMARDSFVDDDECIEAGWGLDEVVGGACLNPDCPASDAARPYLGSCEATHVA